MIEENAPVTHREFGRRFLGSLSWSAGAQLASQIVTFLAGVLLARVLSPSDFGVVGMAIVFTSLVWILGQTGLNAAIIYLDDLEDVDLSTIFWANLAISAFLFAVAFFAAPLVGSFFHTEAVVPVLRVASLGLVLLALGGVQRSLMEKALDFRLLARNQLLASLVYALSSVGLALAGMGVWALVAGRVLEQLADSVLASFSTSWHPRAVFSGSALRRPFRYGIRVWLGYVLFTAQENIDNLVVGRVLGATAVGFYSFAFRLGNVPRYFFAGVIGRVVFPSFASNRDKPLLLKKTYLSINFYSILIAGGLCAGIALVSPEFVSVVYGPKWMPSVPALRILALAAGVFCTTQAMGPVLWAIGKPGLQTVAVFGSSLVLLVGAVIGARFGIAAVAFSVLCAAVVGFGLAQYFVFRELAVGGREFMRAIVPPTAAIAVMSLVVVSWRWFGLNAFAMGTGVWLALAVVFGALGLAAGLALTDRARLLELVGAGRNFSLRGDSPVGAEVES